MSVYSLVVSTKGKRWINIFVVLEEVALRVANKIVSLPVVLTFKRTFETPTHHTIIINNPFFSMIPKMSGGFLITCVLWCSEQMEGYEFEMHFPGPTNRQIPL
jgi:hypothetical protein